jgi:transcription antitermination protein NusB
MITRRSVRIKAMQYIYAFETTQNSPSSQFQQYLEKSILSVKDQYLYVLANLREVCNFVEKDARIKAAKHIKLDKDKNFNTKLLSNILVQYLNNDKEFQVELKNSGVLSLAG